MSYNNEVASSEMQLSLQPCEPECEPAAAKGVRKPDSFCRVSWDQRVTPPDAARFLGIAERTLRQWRDERRGPRAEYRPLWGFVWSYSLQELYEFKLFNALG